MNIFVNDQLIIVPALCNIEQLLQQLESPLKGSAVAVNQQIISRSTWTEVTLNEGDQISLFQAIAGG
ncbi:sulfur carrier protein ThiS [Psychromonas sp.]|uniref:sulfur carrier protein ThiS n=1 Tax=Psychromonas sp. TaxID=1884585 RepID=UPI00356A6A57